MFLRLTIRRMREDADPALGPRWDVKAFHDRVLEDGGVPPAFLRDKVARWAGQVR